MQVGRSLPHADLIDPVFHLALHIEAADDYAAGDGNDQSGSHVEQGDAPAEHGPKQRQGDLIHHGSRDEKGEGDAHGNARFHKADKQRHRRTGTERRHHPQRPRQSMAEELPLAGQDGPGALGGEKGTYNAYGPDDQEQQHEDLGDIQEEEGDGFAQMGALGDPEGVVGDPTGEGVQSAVNRIPGNERQSQEDQLEDLPGRYLGDCRFQFGNGLVGRFSDDFHRHRLLWRSLVIHG